MNILIVGNGFDLSHYLPTKYDHFMVAMQAIENWDESKGDMGFDDLFGSLYEKEDYFFGCTKAIYDTDKIKISEEQIDKLKRQLKENVWYQYFSDHVREVKTWIDFESKIKLALDAAYNFFQAVDDLAQKNSNFETTIRSDKETSHSIFINTYTCRILELLGLFNCKYYKYDIGGQVSECKEHESWISSENEIRENFIQKNRKYNKFKFEVVESHLQNNLNNFSELFNEYLLLIEELFSQKLPSIKNDLKLLKMSKIDKVFSFNYTSTFENLYGTVGVEFLHGKVSKNAGEINIVLGVSSLDKQSLIKYGFYGFLKYHQKLLNDTDYLFLDDSTDLVQKIFSSSNYLDSGTTFNFYIWGHSLDLSDKDYIIDLFSLNDDMDRNVKVTVYYFDQNAKFALLNNLLAILGKDKVEQWMKNKWLVFNPNPEIKFNEMISEKTA